MPLHIPVLVDEVLATVAPRPGQVIVDGTMGGGGHARPLAEAVAPSGLVIGLDRDATAVASARQWADGLPVAIAQANYADTPEVLRELQIEHVDAVLLDLGLSSDQLDDHARGFSFHSAGPLDLRFDPSRGEPASRLVARLSPDRLADLIYRYGEERLSRRIARRIAARRHERPIRTAADLADVVRHAVPAGYDPRIDPATRTFQALRIAVNDELRWLEVALDRLPGCLRPGGRLAVISFHSLEDRRVKHAMRNDPRLAPQTRRPMTARAEEVHRNPRSRSAKLRVARRVIASRGAA